MQNFLDTWKKLTSGSNNRKIFGAAVIVGLLTALVKVASVGKEVVIAWRFGTGNELDAFLIALLIPGFIINVVAQSFNAALIPTYIQIREQEGIKAAQKLFSGAIVWSMGLLVIATILTVSAAPLYLPLIASGFDPQKLDLTFHLLYVIAPIILLSGIIIMWGAVLNAKERFALAALSPLTAPAISVVFILLFRSWGIYALPAGLVCGAILEIVFLGAALQRQGISLLPKWYGFDAHLRQVASQYTPMIAGALLICSAGAIDQTMAAMLSPGSVAVLSYGKRVIASPLSLISIALSAAVVPYFSKMVAHEDWRGLRRTLNYYIPLIFFTTAPLTGLILVFSEPIIQGLFQRGSFTAEDTHLVAQIQAFYALQIPFYATNTLLVRLITSMQLNHILMWVFGFDLLINIILNYLFMQWLGIKGIALATSCVYLFSCFSLLLLSNKKIKEKYCLQKQCDDQG